MWCIPPEKNAEFVCAMENVLEVYKRPYDPQHPVVLCHVMILGYRGANRIMYRRFNDLGHPNL
jgi:hypothetical protein